jgi:catechol 2,3-dioxygenase-like lactoylglutathione lyase family enzyme
MPSQDRLDVHLSRLQPAQMRIDPVARLTLHLEFRDGCDPIRRLRRMDVLFVTSVAVVTADPPQSRKLFMDALGLQLEGEGDGYYSSGNIAGTKHFGVWPLSEAAQACFGTPQWPAEQVVPQASIEFEVASAEAVAAAGDELERAGYELLHQARTEPWGQTVARLLTSDGLIVGISHAPVLHDEAPA